MKENILLHSENIYFILPEKIIIFWTNVQKQQDIVTKNICPKELFIH